MRKENLTTEEMAERYRLQQAEELINSLAFKKGKKYINVFVPHPTEKGSFIINPKFNEG